MSKKLPAPPATVLLDASLLVAANIRSELNHRAANRWVREIERLRYRIVLANHTLAECYAALTKGQRVPPPQAYRIVAHLARGADAVAPTTTMQYVRSLYRMADLGIGSGVTYDAIIAEVARQHGADCIVTLGDGDFKQVFPAHRVITPV